MSQSLVSREIGRRTKPPNVVSEPIPTFVLKRGIRLLLSRKQFVSTTALAVSGAALASNAQVAQAAGGDKAPLHFHVLKNSEYDHEFLMKTLQGGGKNKQCFQASNVSLVAPGIASVHLHMQNSMNAYEFSYPNTGKLSTLAVLMGPGIVFALNDAMWTKYKIGDAFKLADTNIYNAASSNLDLSASPDDPNGVYQDWSSQAVLKRGGVYFVCHNAATAIAGLIAGKSGADPKAVLTEFKANMLPGYHLVPAGVATVQLAAQHGWGFFNID